MSVDTDAIGFVLSSKYREQTMNALETGSIKENTPSGIAERTQCDVAHISRALRDMRDNELVELMVDESRRKGRIYGLTEKGSEVAEHF